jgi:hypothetical protein
MVVFPKAAIWVSIACWATFSLKASDDPIIAKYRAAVCVPFSSHPVVQPHTREWRATLSMRDGSQVIVAGAQVPGGIVGLFYPATGQKFVAANAGDYVYPSDVRVNAQNDLLYVKATGLAGGIWQRTYLFEYDLRQQRLLTRRRVKDDALPEECPDPGQ